MNNKRFISNLLYSLKRQYGAEVTIYQTQSKDFNPKTGKMATTRKRVYVKLGIVLPDTLANKFAYEHSFLAANRQFTYGAQWDQRQRLIIIDGHDLPKDFTIGLEDSVVHNDFRYVVNKADVIDGGLGYLLTVVKAENNLPLQIIERTLSSAVCLGQSTGVS